MLLLLFLSLFIFTIIFSSKAQKKHETNNCFEQNIKTKEVLKDDKKKVNEKRS